MGIEENITQVSGKAVDALGTNPLMLGILILMATFLGFSAWQQHDSNGQNRDMLIKILEFRHDEILAVLERCVPIAGKPSARGPDLTPNSKEPF
jgi:hypothetical protein